MDDANERDLSHEEFYHLSDEVLDFSVSYQGYGELLESIETGGLSRIRFMHEIWRAMPEPFYANVGEQVLHLLLES